MQRKVLLFVALLSTLCFEIRCDPSKLLLWYEKVKNPFHQCSLSCTKEDGPPVFEIADCDEKGAKFNYFYKPEKKSKGWVFQGSATITFGRSESDHGKFNHGIKSRKCLKPFNKDIMQIRGKFNEDKLEGPVTIEFYDQTFIVGFAKENHLIGILRHFLEGSVLKNVTQAETGFTFWARDDNGILTVKPFKDPTRFLITNFDKAFECKNSDSDRYLQCKIAGENIFNDILSNDCSIAIQETEVTNQTEEDWFKLHPVTLEIHRKTDSLYPECQKSNEWNTNKILESITKWKTSLTRNPNLHWFHEPSSEPLDLNDPKLKIKLNLFEKRQHFNQRDVAIRFSGRNTVTGVMRNGLIQIDLPIDIATKEEWRNPIEIVLKNDGIQTLNMDNVFESSELFVTGRLKQGQLDGFVVMNGMLANDPEGICQEIIFPRLGFVGHFKNGIPSGICWRELEGGAWIYGQVDNEGKFTGDHIAYIYPDMKIALIGQFKNGLMVNGRQTEVTGERCNEMGIKELRFGEPVGPVFHYDPPNHESFGDQPLIGDPLDNYYIELKPSLIYPNAGEGAHAKVDVPAHTVISLYGGRLLTKDQMESFKNELQQKFDKNNWNGLHPEVVASWKYRHQLSSCEMTIDIPGEFEPVSKYRGTIGHKVNHSFKPNCQYLPIDSPRFGQILSVKTLVPVAKGEEFLASYGYSFTAGPLWYKDLFLQFMEEHPNEHDAIQRISLGKSREELQEMYNEYLKTATKSFASIGIGELETIEEKK